MQELLPVNELKIGMHVTIPGSWFRHPFLRNRFVLNSRKDIDKMMDWGLTRVSVESRECGIPIAVIDEACPTDTVAPEPAESIPPDLMEFLHDSGIAPDFRAAAVKACSKKVMKQLMENTPDEETICAAKKAFTR
jgi:hypothetical protein